MKKAIQLFLLGTIILFSSCKKDKPAATGEYYYDAVIDGVQYKESIAANNTDPNLEAGSGTAGGADITFMAHIINNNVNGTTMTIAKGVLLDYFNTTVDDFKNFFTPGNYTYAAFATNGMTIFWYDKNGTEWSTDLGTADQTGSTIKIASYSERPDLGGTMYLKTTVQFTCKLYDGTGNVKQASGTFVGLFGRI